MSTAPSQATDRTTALCPVSTTATSLVGLGSMRGACAPGDETLRRRLDLARMTCSERQAALSALVLGRDIADVLIWLARTTRRMLGPAPRVRRAHRSSPDRAAIRARRLAFKRRTLLGRAPRTRVQ